jgi:hypothetical protein
MMSILASTCVSGSLSNVAEFAEDFGCKKGEPVVGEQAYKSGS